MELFELIIGIGGWLLSGLVMLLVFKGRKDLAKAVGGWKRFLEVAASAHHPDSDGGEKVTKPEQLDLLKRAARESIVTLAAFKVKMPSKIMKWLKLII